MVWWGKRIVAILVKKIQVLFFFFQLFGEVVDLHEERAWDIAKNSIEIFDRLYELMLKDGGYGCCFIVKTGDNSVPAQQTISEFVAKYVKERSKNVENNKFITQQVTINIKGDYQSTQELILKSIERLGRNKSISHQLLL
eukprot:TRINITY_DN1238_c0_g1_i3.p1 TRINITY_DN1238_c0_g1~~TRINITY_DN1238_c0_g1_i3.p1  ORF type:complete len:140 (-),score=4.19 TRINITY_DN1238_c0_g1_i3:60-479(-)